VIWWTPNSSLGENQWSIVSSNRIWCRWMSVQTALAISDYFDEGARTTRWFVDGVVRYHRSLSTILNQLRTVGLTLELVAEPRPTRSALERNPECRDDLIRPAVLGFVRSQHVHETCRPSTAPACRKTPRASLSWTRT
jgi:hypothetical protein